MIAVSQRRSARLGIGRTKIPGPCGLALLTWALACSGDDETSEVVVGSPCASNASYCEAWDELTRCMDGHWTRIDCVEACSGTAMGCIVSGSVQHPKATCLCEDGPATTGPSDGPMIPDDICVDAEVLRLCGDGRCTEYDCSDVCAEQPDSPMSLGCRDRACACTAIGRACDPGEQPRCSGEIHLVSCVEGVWSVSNCHMDCDPYWIGDCVYGPDGIAVCSCD
jgi:hypothetical protein